MVLMRKKTENKALMGGDEDGGDEDGGDEDGDQVSSGF